MVELKPITEDNFVDAFNLRLGAGQEEFVSHPIRSLAQAYVYRDQCQPFGIYADGRMAGYVMVIYDYDIPEYDIWHMVVDEAEQGRGFGSEALDRVLEYIGTRPFGDSPRVALTCNKDNLVALRLYEKKGFTATGTVDVDEIELAMTGLGGYPPIPLSRVHRGLPPNPVSHRQGMEGSRRSTRRHRGLRQYRECDRRGRHCGVSSDVEFQLAESVLCGRSVSVMLLVNDGNRSTIERDWGVAPCCTPACTGGLPPNPVSRVQQGATPQSR